MTQKCMLSSFYQTVKKNKVLNSVISFDFPILFMFFLFFFRFSAFNKNSYEVAIFHYNHIAASIIFIDFPPDL